ncbi:hypothetical protein D0809_19825 [Flavobacterium circumlabens]|uniref:Uncharacterized protein n=1 Tax=Flavobacterium circumlabens TaxID=2133765 RepID=A0A4Y7U831_9FLAO|nr:hypothetical protein D0809_19825 [Flavobacterium circumlabens]
MCDGKLCHFEIKTVLFNHSKFVSSEETCDSLSLARIDWFNERVTENSKFQGLIIINSNCENVIMISTRLILCKNGKLHAVSKKAEIVREQFPLFL